ncbi:hypothetical protein L2E82_31573 [Cichorium intybus]|uniref:Uncharacterized protein n=1 Tax=Cichorium intybus TaxID=13427 RepID=A0ACB9BDK6_CICIN|nr:hypothetical protein L2E82_31573 [Cichorium intybus]
MDNVNVPFEMHEVHQDSESKDNIYNNTTAVTKIILFHDICEFSCFLFSSNYHLIFVVVVAYLLVPLSTVCLPSQIQK